MVRRLYYLAPKADTPDDPRDMGKNDSTMADFAYCGRPRVGIIGRFDPVAEERLAH